METHPFKDWVYEWDGAAHPEGEGDITFRIRSYDGLDYSPIEVRQYKLNLVAPTLLVDVPTEGSEHQTGKILFQGTASDPTVERLAATFNKFGSPSLARTDSLSSSSSRVRPAGPMNGTWLNCHPAYTAKVWAADSDFCIGEAVEADGCVAETRTVNINNDNIPPNLQLSWIGAEDQSSGGIDGDTVRASSETKIIGVARDIGGRHPCRN